MKLMNDENLLRLSELADRSINDLETANILLCYLLYRVEEPVEEEMLYDIAVTGGIINYFTFQEAMQSLLKAGSVERIQTGAGEKMLRVTPTGKACASRLKTIAAKSYRDQIVTAAKKALRRRRNARNAQISYEMLEHGCHLHVTLTDRDLTLLDLKLFTPDREQAEQCGEQILADPSALYHDIIQAVMRQHEEELDLSDN